MLVKLLNYEFKAMGRILLPFYGALILLGLISSIYTRFIPDDITLLNLSGIILIMLFVFMIIFATALSFIMTILRFKRNLLDNEGYIMNTLPVTPWQNISAKLITAIVFQILAAISMALAIIAFILPMPDVSLSNFITGFAELYNNLKQFNINFGILYIETILLGIVGLISINLSLYSAMCIGHSFNSHKVLISILIYILFYMINQFVQGSILIILSATHIGPIYDYSSYSHIMELWLLIYIIYRAVFAAVYGFLVHYFMKNKLNLQ